MLRWKRQRKDEIDLILSSSGVRAPCFVGGLKAILEKGYRINRIAGTSGGAIVAAAYALGISMSEIEERTQNIPYDKFRDYKITNLLSVRNPSIYTGETLSEFYKDLFGEAKLGDFQIDCKISVVTIIGRKRILLCRKTFPELPVWKAVRMSSTIPFVFPYLTLEGQPVTDGGLVTNMFDVFPERHRQIIALTPKADHDIRKVEQDVQASRLLLWTYIKILAEFFLDLVDNQHVPQEEWAKTIIIPTEEVGGFSFHIGQEEVDKLVQVGYNSVISSPLLPKI